MNTESKTSEYMLLFRGTHWHKGLSPEQLEQVTNDWMAWFKRLKESGKVKAGQPLEREGKIVSGKKGRTVSDGPFAEAKEAVGGYFLLNVDTIEEATAIAQDCPGLDYGAVVEVRPVADMCPAAQELGIEPELAHAHA